MNTMNWEIFSTTGYASVALWACIPALWLVHKLRRPRRWLCHLALLLGVVALVLAKINSATYVNRIRVDRSQQIAEQLAKQEQQREKARQMAKEERLANVADIQFPEDSRTDALDEAGMDAADQQYMHSFEKEPTPEWKKEKKARTAGAEDDSLEAMIGAVEAEEGFDADVLIEETPAQPIWMSDADKAMANRLDVANLWAADIFLCLAVLGVVADYFSRANVYEEAYFPLPLPSSWLEAFTPAPAVSALPDPPRRSVLEELQRFVKRGDSFIYFTDRFEQAAKVPGRAYRLPFGLRPVDILPIDGEFGKIDDDFVFETLWYNRSSFVCDSPQRAEEMLSRFVELLAERWTARARARQTVHIVWDIDTPISESLRRRFASLSRDTGYTLLLCK